MRHVYTKAPIYLYKVRIAINRARLTPTRKTLGKEKTVTRAINTATKTAKGLEGGREGGKARGRAGDFEFKMAEGDGRD